MVNKAQKIANARIKASGGKRSIVRRSPVTRTRRAWNFKSQEKKKK